MLSHSLLLPVCKNNVDICSRSDRPQPICITHRLRHFLLQRGSGGRAQCIALSATILTGRICPSITLRLSWTHRSRVLLFQGLDLPPWGVFALVFKPSTISDDAAWRRKASQIQATTPSSRYSNWSTLCLDRWPSAGEGGAHRPRSASVG